jgi:hypothetical protein
MGREPELSRMGFLPARRPPHRTASGVAFLLCFFIALCCWATSVDGAVHVGGLAGEHGTLTVERCWTKYGKGGDHSATRMCGGTFRSDDGRNVDTDASVEAEGRTGDRIEVQRDGGDYLLAGAGELWLYVGMFFVGCLAAGLGMLAWTMNRRFRTADELFYDRRPVRSTPTGRAALSLIVGSAGLAAVCFALANLM